MALHHFSVRVHEVYLPSINCQSEMMRKSNMGNEFKSERCSINFLPFEMQSSLRLGHSIINFGARRLLLRVVRCGRVSRTSAYNRWESFIFSRVSWRMCRDSFFWIEIRSTLKSFTLGHTELRFLKDCGFLNIPWSSNSSSDGHLSTGEEAI